MGGGGWVAGGEDYFLYSEIFWGGYFRSIKYIIAGNLIIGREYAGATQKFLCWFPAFQRFDLAKSFLKPIQENYQI